MDDLAAAADADVDAVFTRGAPPGAAGAILGRVTQRAGRPASELPRPGRRAPPGAARQPHRHALDRGGAAAGLFIGVGLGLFLNDTTPAPERVAAKRIGRGRGASGEVPARRCGTAARATAADDDAFLTDLDLALESPRTSALRALRRADAPRPRRRRYQIGCGVLGCGVRVLLVSYWRG